MSYSSTVLADSPIRYYRLDESNGTIATDLGSQAQNGTLSGSVTLSHAGLLGTDSDKAMLFDGATGFISAANTIASSQDCSFECWVNVPSFIDDGGSVSRRIVVQSNDASNGYQLTLGVGGLFVWAIKDGGVEYITSTSGNSTNTTYHLIGTYTAATHAVVLYVNGAVSANNGGASGWGLGAIFGFNIGRRPDGGGFCPGVIDEVAIYTYALSPPQIAAHYTAGLFTKRLYVPFGTPRAFGGTIMPQVIKPPLIYTPRAFGATLLTDSRIFIPRAFGGTYIPDDPTLLWVPRAFGGTTQIPTAVALSRTIAGRGTLTETLSLATSLTDTIPGIGTLTPTLSANLALPSTTIPGVGTLTMATPSLSTALSTTIPGIGTLTPTLSANLDMGSVTIPGVGTLTATLSANTALADTLAGTGIMSATLAATTPLSVADAGVGTLSATLSATTAIVATMAGTGTLSAVFGIPVALFVLCAGAGTLSPTLSVPVGLPFFAATWITRDGQAAWKTRDDNAAWATRDEQATWDTRDDNATWDTRDEQAIWKVRG